MNILNKIQIIQWSLLFIAALESFLLNDFLQASFYEYKLVNISYRGKTSLNSGKKFQK